MSARFKWEKVEKLIKYKVLKYILDESTDELEEELNKLAENGWEIIDIVQNIKGSGNLIYQSFSNDYIMIFLKKYL